MFDNLLLSLLKSFYEKSGNNPLQSRYARQLPRNFGEAKSINQATILSPALARHPRSAAAATLLALRVVFSNGGIYSATLERARYIDTPAPSRGRRKKLPYKYGEKVCRKRGKNG